MSRASYRSVFSVGKNSLFGTVANGLEEAQAKSGGKGFLYAKCHPCRVPQLGSISVEVQPDGKLVAVSVESGGGVVSVSGCNVGGGLELFFFCSTQPK